MTRNYRSLLSLLFLPLALSFALGQSSLLSREGRLFGEERMSPALSQEIEFLTSHDPQRKIPVIVQVKRDFFEREGLRSDTRRSANRLPLVHSYLARLSGPELRLLMESSLVEYVTFDMPLAVTGGPAKQKSGSAEANSFLQTLGADQVKYSGSGVGIAIFDSGVDLPPDLKDSQLAATVDFTSGGPEVIEHDFRDRDYKYHIDAYGHGTHVTGIIFSTGAKSSGAHRGIAPQAHFVDLRVIGPDGIGRTSDLIKAIDWLILHKDQYGIKVANLSLGHPPVESYLRDPLCQAVQRMVEAGIVTVVSAGNLGKTGEEAEIWGGITSPGIHPAVITVGPVNTRGTVSRRDDIASTYGSRGPSIDGYFKPDLVAPGNAIPSLLVKDSWVHLNHPDLIVDRERSSEEDRYVELSGASMATAFVSGTAALMLQAKPDLSPSMVKLILTLSASKMETPHMLEQGNGMLNVKTAVELAEQANTRQQTLNSRGVTPYWSLGDETVWSGGAVAFGDRILYSPMIDPNVSPLWGSAILWADTIFWADSLRWAEGIFDATELWSDTIFWADAGAWTDSSIWPHTMLWADAILWADSTLKADAILWADSMFFADSLQAQALLAGDAD